jgi:PLP dependent protein
MTKNNSRTSRQPRNAGQQAITQPLIGHEPERWQQAGVALGHRAFYSEIMNQDAKARLDAVHTKIDRTAKISGRAADDVALIAISKTHPAEAIRPLIDAGQRRFGENRVQEAASKWPALIAATPDIELHLVGQLQSNKAEEAVALFDVIHSVDRASLITALAKAQEKLGKRPRFFLQVNIGDEPQKGGCPTADTAALLEQAQRAGLDIMGLMAVPPADVEAAPYFALLAKMARELGVSGLSMGMSGDFETAIMLGATYVRVGSALFGARV